MKTPSDILEKILLPLNSEWKVSEVNVSEEHGEVEVKLRYAQPYVEAGGRQYGLYDHRKPRRWRHMDLWQYKTYIVAELPRYKDELGFYHTVEVPWAEASERMSTLLKKKR
jgi:transposase